MNQKSNNLNDIFAYQFRSFLNSIEGKRISSVQNRERIGLILFLLDELSQNSEGWEKNKNTNEETVAESLLIAVELSEMFLSVNSKKIKSEKLQNKVSGITGQLKNISRTAVDLELARLNEINQAKRKMYSESDDTYRQMNHPELRYDVTQQGTGRNANRDSKNYTSSGIFKYSNNI
ncbi:hypothetical protein ACQKMV_07755 [Lysinibacillus sp. NPDC094403]|uniref:hypothetical protein n=1 Tax=Lysinibacillus sp. NPDC094403 TaxID=3390581 RepID=UPI003D021806